MLAVTVAGRADLEAKISEQSSSLRKLQHDLEEKGTELDRLKREHLAEREAASSAVDKSITRAQDAAGAGDAHKAVRLYREAAALRPQDRELAAKLQEAELRERLRERLGHFEDPLQAGMFNHSRRVQRAGNPVHRLPGAPERLGARRVTNFANAPLRHGSQRVHECGKGRAPKSAGQLEN